MGCAGTTTKAVETAYQRADWNTGLKAGVNEGILRPLG
jgi:hypothetical protein